MIARFALFAAALATFAVNPLRAETVEQVIARARAYLGSESALNAVTSIRFTGMLETTEKIAATDDKSKLVDQPVRWPVEIVVQKPYQQQFTLTRPDSIETRALDGYDGWARSTSLQNPKEWRLRLLDAPEIKQLRANTWENLNFFSGLEKKGGHVELGGEATVDGVACVKLSFVHTDDIIFLRFFDKDSGRLVRTETEKGGDIREEGELIVGGIRFPRKVINKAANGQVTTLAFDKVVLNEPIPAADFAVPALPTN